MARFSRTRTSRTVVSIVVVAITIGAAFQFHRIKRSTAAAPPMQMSVEQSGGAVVSKPPLPSPAGPNGPGQMVQTLVTQTPDSSRLTVPSQMASQIASPLPSALPSPVPSTHSPAQDSVTTSSPKASGTILASYSPTSPGTLFSDAGAKVSSGDLIGARTLLNGALVSGTLSPADTDAVKKQMAQINQTLIFSPRQFPKDPLGGIYVVKSGDRFASIGNAHGVPYEFLLMLNRMTDARKLRYGQKLKIINGPFHAVVTKSKFTLDVYLGSPGGPDSTYITTFMVGLGTDNSTPTGTWAIRNKVTHPAYFPPEGHAGPVLAPDDPKNPLGSYWMGLEGTDGQAVGQQSYGIHGTIDPTSVGKQSSMGCIRLRNEDVEVLYKMLMQGKSTVIVRD